MSNILEKRVAIKPTEENHNSNYLEFRIYYSLGGCSIGYYDNEARGYYLGVTPIKLEREFVSFVGFSGYKKVIKAVKRQSKKAEKEVLDWFEENYSDILIEALNYLNLELIEE